jgi:hypothetical protein
MSNDLGPHLAYFSCDVCGNDVPTTPQFAKVHEHLIRVRHEHLEAFRIEAWGARCATCGDRMTVVIDGQMEGAR